MPNLNDYLRPGAAQRLAAASKGASDVQIELAGAWALEFGAALAKLDERITALEQHATMPTAAGVRQYG